MNRKILPNRNSFTYPTVCPANWNKPGASIKTSWRIRYRYFDPVHCPSGKQFSLRDMNGYKSLPERREATKELLRLLKERLHTGWNPITGKDSKPENVSDVDRYTPVLEALQFAFENKICGDKTKIQLRQALNQIKKAIRQLEFNHLNINEIRRRHVKIILGQIGKNKGGWSSPTNFNNFRSSLKMLFDVLDEIEALEADPISKIRKMSIEHKIRETLSPDERKKVNEHLKSNYPSFYRFLHIFFHSGARISELLRMKGKDVDLVGQRFKISILKGKRRMQVWKTVKDIALPFWEQLDINEDDYVFSKGLEPGKLPINPLQVSRRWRLLVKNKLGIKADFYSLKHSHTTEIVNMLSTTDAAFHNSHADTSMVERIYDLRRNDRERDRIKGLNNPL